MGPQLVDMFTEAEEDSVRRWPRFHPRGRGRRRSRRRRGRGGEGNGRPLLASCPLLTSPLRPPPLPHSRLLSTLNFKPHSSPRLVSGWVLELRASLSLSLYIRLHAIQGFCHPSWSSVCLSVCLTLSLSLPPLSLSAALSLPLSVCFSI